MRAHFFICAALSFAGCFTPVGEWEPRYDSREASDSGGVAEGEPADGGAADSAIPEHWPDAGLGDSAVSDTKPDVGAAGDASFECPPDQPDACGSNCTDLGRDDQNCGACGRPCAAGERCVEGSCARWRRVFVTSETYTGDLRGLSGADSKCQDLASRAGIGNRYKALLMNGNNVIETRVPEADAYALVDGTVVATSQRQFLRGTLLHAINVTESGVRVAGSAWSWCCYAASCLGWLSSRSQHLGASYVLDTLEFGNQGTFTTCDSKRPLLCLEQ